MKPVCKLLLDTNIVVDYLEAREPFFEKARLMFIVGAVGDFSLWVSASQMTDLVFILSDGGKERLVPEVLEQLRDVRSILNVAPVGAQAVDKMLATRWKDPEDALVQEVALQIHADAIVTRDTYLLEKSKLPAFDCAGLFDWLRETQGISYEEVEGTFC